MQLIDSLKKKFNQVMESHEPEESGGTGKVSTPKKSRPHDPDKPPEPSLAKLVKGKSIDHWREITENLPEIEKGCTTCPVCKADYMTQNAVVTHYSKFHKSEYLYHCEDWKRFHVYFWI